MFDMYSESIYSIYCTNTFSLCKYLCNYTLLCTLKFDSPNNAISLLTFLVLNLRNKGFYLAFLPYFRVHVTGVRCLIFFPSIIAICDKRQVKVPQEFSFQLFLNKIDYFCNII